MNRHRASQCCRKISCDQRCWGDAFYLKLCRAPDELSDGSATITVPGERGKVVARAHLQIVLNQTDLPSNLKQALTRIDASVTCSRLSDALTSGVSRRADAVVIVPGPNHSAARPAVERLLSSMTDRPRAALVITPAPTSTPLTLRGVTSAPVGYVNGVGSAELAGRLAAMIEYGQALAAAPTSRLVHEAREAGELQRDLLPADPPAIPGFSVRVVYRPAGEVSGDMYGFARIDTERSALWLADVCGHGLPAAMLTGFVKQCLSDSMALSWGQSNEPEGVLHRLNRELLRQNLSGCNFAACCWAVVDHQTHRVSWARGGTPYPLLLKRGKATVEIRSAGTVLGAIEKPELQRCGVTLEPGDSVIFRSDGLDALLRGDTPLPLDSIAHTRWFRSLDAERLEEALADVEHLCNHRRGLADDDICVVAIERQ